MTLTFRLGRFLIGSWLRLFHQFRIYHPERLPKTGGIILACNHASHIDPPAVGVAAGLANGRGVHFMARSTLFRPAWFGAVLHSVHAHPIERGKGADQDWDSFIRVVKAGKALLVFPEGTRTETGELQRGKSGFGLLAYMTKTPVYPVYIRGSYAAWPKGGKYRTGKPISVHFGACISIDDLLSQPQEKKMLRQISERVMQAIADLKQEAETE